MHASRLIFIPALNEEQTVGAVVTGMMRTVADADVLVIDDGSTDGTAAAAAAAGAVVVSHAVNLGLGAAIQTGYLYARQRGYRAVAHCDSDGQHTPESVGVLLDAVGRGECDLAVGSRFLAPPPPDAPPDTYRPSRMRSAGIWVFRHMLSTMTRQRFTDPTSGLRAASRRVVMLFADDYGADYPELESLARLARGGYVVREYPVIMLDRKAGESKITPGKTLFWVFNGAVSLTAAATRPRLHANEDAH